MIPQADLDRALARWKSRQAGQEPPTPGPVDLAGEHPATAAKTIADTPVVVNPDGSSASINLSDFDDPDVR